MRRGHPGISGWRNDNQRHFRPRSGGTPHYRPPRGYSHLDASRFQSPGPRSLLDRIHYVPPNLGNDQMPEHHDRQGYRGGRNQRRPSGRGQYPHQGPRQMYPYHHRMRQGDVPEQNSYQDTANYKNQPWETVNSMGDPDHRKPQRTNRNSPWASSPYQYEDRSPTKNYRHQDNTEHTKVPQPDYTGHRPPASDHYGGNHGSTMENSKTFSRSVDDTVDIVRKKLLNRDSQPSSESPPHNEADAEKEREPVGSRYPTTPQDQPTKKKPQKLRNIKSNCDKIKNKIMHQLFMMDKDKIHKLMDNPNSSSKFEYAISSLVTESQNSFNRHLRSVAEKSLCGSSSTEFIHDDNNTIYEDTFMKQMQCILDPQDTVLLEDIKPMVLAELSKVLQLDDFQLRQDAQAAPSSRDDLSVFDQYSLEEPFDDFSSLDPYSPIDETENYYEQKQRFVKPPSPDYARRRSVEFSNDQLDFESSLLFERRSDRKSRDGHRRRPSEEKRKRDRRSIDIRPEDTYTRSDETPKPLFDTNVPHLSDEEDPFAELDRQYHVAVDHNFIKNDYTSSPQPSNISSSATSPARREITIHIPKCDSTPVKGPPIVKAEKPATSIKDEIENQLQDIAKSPLKFLPPPIKKADWETKQDLTNNNPHNTYTPRKYSRSDSTDDNTAESTASNASEKHEPIPELSQSMDISPDRSESGISVKSTSLVDSRKRSCDQKPSHRKEKRKKSEANQQDVNKQILNKNIIIHVSDCAAAAKTAEKSIFNVYFSKENNAIESSKDSKKIESGDKKYSDRYVKRKEKDSISCKKPKEKDVETKKKHDSNTTSHSILSPTDVSNTSSQTASKVDGQTKLKPIDMFVEHQKKPPTPHLAHRNTSVPAIPTRITPVELKPVVLSRKITKRHIATQVVRKCLTKETQTIESKCGTTRVCQTDKKKIVTKGTQTDPVSFKPASKSTDTFERMKEIDMEIQALLQEKFKLYNSLESRDSGPNTMQSLGMAVLNVTPVDPIDNECPDDDIVDDFANIPVEELEQIALESVREIENIQEVTSMVNVQDHLESVGEQIVNISDEEIAAVQEDQIGNVPEEQIVSVPEEQIVSVPEEHIVSVPEEHIESLREKQNQLTTQTDKSRHRHKDPDRRRSRNNSLSTNASTTSSKSKRERSTKPPNISLIEQIITDSRPLEDIISLEDLEMPPRKKSLKPKIKIRFKPKKKGKKDSPHRKTDKKDSPRSKSDKKDSPQSTTGKKDAPQSTSDKKDASQSTSDEKGAPQSSTDKKDARQSTEYNPIKPCSVLLKREDLNKLLRKFRDTVKKRKGHSTRTRERENVESRRIAQRVVEPDRIIEDTRPAVTKPSEQTSAQNVLMVEAAINDIQFDMLDVSEDIVIGDVCEVKCSEEKEASDRSTPAVCEEIILDNSQSSADAAEGGGSGECKVYDYSADESLRRDSITVAGNGDAVLAIECIDGNFIAACLDGNVYYFSGEGRLLNTLRGSNLAVTCLTLVRERGRTTVYTGSLDSRIRYYDLETGLEKGPECNVLSPIQTMDRAWDTVFVGTRTGYVLQFECKNNMLIPVTTVKFSDQSILALRAMKEGARKVLLVAARSEPVTIKDAQTGLLLRTLEGPKMTVYTLLLEDGKVYCGTSSHQIHVFDYASGSHIGSHEGGKGAVCLRANGGLVFAGCYDGCIYVYKEGGGTPLAQLRGPSLMLLSLAVLDTKIIAGYKDRSLYIWKIPQAIFQEMIL